jgi:hypothetical protein
MRCALCHQPIDLRSAWKGTHDRFYCSEFCADSEGSAPIDQNSQKRLIDRLCGTTRTSFTVDAESTSQPMSLMANPSSDITEQ